MSTTTYILTSDEADIYDSDSGPAWAELRASLRVRFGDAYPPESPSVMTEIHHPDGFVIECYYRPED